MKHTKWICLLLTLFLLTGCTGGGETVPTTIPETTVPPTTAATEPALIELEAVNLLTKQTFCATPSVAVLDERTVAFLTTEYDREKAITVSHLLVLDLYTDTIVAEKTVDCALSLPVQSQLPGVLPVFDVAGDQWLVLNRNLETEFTFDCEKNGGVFAPDLTSYYYVSAQRLCRMDLGTGETTVLETELELPVEAITDYRAEDDVLLIQVHTQYYLTDLCVGAVKADTGELLLLTDGAQKCFFAADGIVLQHNEAVTSADLIRIGWEAGSALRLTDVLPSDSVYRSWCIPMSDYQLTLYYDSLNAYSLSSFLLYRFREGYESCELYDLTDGLEPDKIVTLPGGNLLAVDYNRRGTEIALICPEMLTFTAENTPETYEMTLIDSAIPESYAEQAAPVAVPEALAEVRTLADDMEERYDITILLSNQCDTIIEACGFELQPSDEAGLENEAKLLLAALEDLEDSLALYPAGFFTQFRNEADDRGILVLLVENITAGSIDDDNVDVLGVTYDMGDWYPIAVDVTTDDLPSTYCHEIWHAMENKIMDEDPMLFNDIVWGRLNPSGFSYKGAVEGYYYETEYTYLGGDAGKDSYFVDAYGKTKPQEDRARIMEYIMTSDYTAQKLMEAPVLYEKMRLMVDAVREIFDTTGWENVLWERFHPDSAQ